MRGKLLMPDLVERCRRLRRQGYSLGQIVDSTRLPKSTVYSYIRSIVVSPQQREIFYIRQRKAIIARNKLRKGISRPWNHVRKVPPHSVGLTGCLAHFLFDGSLIGSQACYYNRSRKLVMKQSRAVKINYGLEGKVVSQATGVLRLTFNSVELVHVISMQLRELLSYILIAPQKCQIIFLKAFFDDEGCVYLSRTQKDYYVRGYQKDLRILFLVQALLGQLTIRSRVYKRPNSVSWIEVDKNLQNLVKFAHHINFSRNVRINPGRRNSVHSFAYEKRSLLKLCIDKFLKKGL